MIGVSALLLAAVGVLNGWPLLYSDSIGYLDEGRRVLRSLLHGPVDAHWKHRSLLYSALIWPFHRSVAPWGVAAFHCLVVASAIHATLRVLLPGLPAWREWAMVGVLVLASGVGWHSVLVMPDILSAVLVLAFFLATFAAPATRVGRAVLVLAVGFAVASHISNLALALGLLVAAAAGRRVLDGAWPSPGDDALVLPAAGIALAVVSQLVVNARYEGHPSLLGRHEPHLLARVVEDGTASLYLERSCGRISSPLCDYRDALPQVHYVFLFRERGVLSRMTAEERKRVEEEELSFVLATVLSVPVEQLRASLHNFGAALWKTGVTDLGSSPYVESDVYRALRDGERHYGATRQARGTLPLEAASRVHAVARAVALLACIALGWRLRHERAVRWLGWTVGIGLVLNAGVTGVLSTPQPRYGARLDWLLLLTALVIAERSWRARMQAAC